MKSKSKLRKYMTPMYAIIVLLLAAVLSMFLFMGTGLGKESFVKIQNSDSNNGMNCIDSSMTEAVLAKCANVTGQQWSVTGRPEDVYHQVKNEYAGKDKCLKANQTSEKLTMEKCTSDPSQQWKLQNGLLESAYKINGSEKGCIGMNTQVNTLNFRECSKVNPQKKWSTRENN